MKSRESIYSRMPTTDIFCSPASESEIEILTGIITRHPAVCTVYLFGSAARGEMRSGEAGYQRPSDIDFFILVESESERMPLHVNILQSIARENIFRPVDIIVWTREEWANAQNHALGRTILREGRLLFNRSNVV